MNKKPIEFEQLPEVDDLSGVIEDMFDVKLDIEGGWGYDNNSSVIVNSIDVPIDPFLYMFANIRATIEMNLILDEDQKFSGINTAFIEGKQIEIEDKTYDMITFEITAMKESEYTNFIDEYKKNYEKNQNFDFDDHFKRREQHTISIERDFWFFGLEKYYENTQNTL